MPYSYPYDIKIIGVPPATDGETADEETANICLRIFAGIGAGITFEDTDIAHRIQSRNSTRGQRHPLMIYKFVRRMACNKIMATRNNTNRQQMILASPQLKLVELECFVIWLHAYKTCFIQRSLIKRVTTTSTVERRNLQSFYAKQTALESSNWAQRRIWIF